MNIQQFLEVIYTNRDLLGDVRELAVPEDTHCMSAHKGCPLRTAMVVHCDVSTQWEQLFMTEAGLPVAINPDPELAAHLLGLNEVFTDGIVKGWDSGTFYDDEGDWLDWNFAFAGFLVGVSLRPAPLQLTSGD